MSLLESIQAGFGGYFKFDGRASRPEFWYWIGLYVLVAGGLIAASGGTGLGSVLAVALVPPTIAVGVRRMHDVGKAGWMFAIPLYSLYLAARPGDPATNAYGVVPGANAPGWGARS